MLRFVIVPDLQDLVALPRKLTEPFVALNHYGVGSSRCSAQQARDRAEVLVKKAPVDRLNPPELRRVEHTLGLSGIWREADQIAL